ncbi:MAG: nucleotidyltransferase domain-containing protein [Candidatus Asgardarchaeum californiense]|nr:MAG: nucleotidyltransferase domain-containing protein [Candidatus Asgardarchaeum californiense]
MEKRILKELKKIEKKHDVKILYACESGSRAWGFPSVDSDYDVRFLYLHRPEWYLSINEKRDVIELPINDDLDINGWDMRKALRLFRKSNPSLLEWVNSPIVYRDGMGVGSAMGTMSKEYFSQTVCSYHYLHMAKGNFKDYLKFDTVWVKKYLYVLRPLLAVVWMQQDRGIVPVDFNYLVDNIDIPDNLRKEIKKLIAEKRAGKELGRGMRNYVISNYVERELDEQLKLNHKYPKLPVPVGKLDKFFISLLSAFWGFDNL